MLFNVQSNEWACARTHTQELVVDQKQLKNLLSPHDNSFKKQNISMFFKMKQNNMNLNNN